MIGVHPRALLEFDDQEPGLQNEIRELMKGYDSPREFYVGRLTEGIATLGAAFYPKRVIVRLSDFKSNEYANLVGGERYEPEEREPDARLPRRRTLRFRKLPRLLRPGVRSDEARA
ncbi:phosphoenolpyruvate synthase [Klebsiella pneumoniae]|uniref:Phosphoenolpyruvate synthase n=1 Tax=Klebsiella pneumoniae TaxID=573 RepID=A0A4P0Y4T2_KLEPN|nr:phosphoenolpyruvate synthase [Klebsiella pneumoniae]